VHDEAGTLLLNRCVVGARLLVLVTAMTLPSWPGLAARAWSSMLTLPTSSTVIFGVVEPR
jgi:hypothetical protein